MRGMHRYALGLCCALLIGTALAASTDNAAPPDRKPAEADRGEAHKFEPFKVEAVTSNSSVTIGAHAIAYQAIAGTLIVHPKGWDDVPRDPGSEHANAPAAEEGAEPKNPTAEASMFYVAYFKSGPG